VKPSYLKDRINSKIGYSTEETLFWKELRGHTCIYLTRSVAAE